MHIVSALPKSAIQKGFSIALFANYAKFGCGFSFPFNTINNIPVNANIPAKT